jgi:hypothetical protein
MWGSDLRDLDPASRKGTKLTKEGRASASSRLLRLLLLQNLDTFPGVTPARLTEKHPVAGFSAKGLDLSGKACCACAVLAGNLVRHVGALWEGRPPGGRSFLHQENKRPRRLRRVSFPSKRGWNSLVHSGSFGRVEPRSYGLLGVSLRTKPIDLPVAIDPVVAVITAFQVLDVPVLVARVGGENLPVVFADADRFEVNFCFCHPVFMRMFAGNNKCPMRPLSNLSC